VNVCEVYGKVTAELDYDKNENFDAIFERVMRVVIERRRAIRQNDGRN
jgi:hypothetical protein